VNRFDALLSEYLDGTIDPAGRDELARLVEADPATLREFVDLVREHRILAAELGEPLGQEFTQRVLRDLDKGKTQFIRAVMKDVRGSSPGGGRPVPRPRRPMRPQTGEGPAWGVWAMVAAGIVVMVGLLLYSTGGGEGEHRSPDQRLAKGERPEGVPGHPTPESPKPRGPETAPPEPRSPERPIPKTGPPQTVPPAQPPELPIVTPPKPIPPVPEKTPVPEPVVPKPDAVPPKPEEKTTVVEVATVEAVQGDVLVSRGGVKKPFHPGDAVLGGDILEGQFAVRYPDGTELDFRGGAFATFPASDSGKRVVIDRGYVRAKVSKQPPGKSMVLATPHGEATVLGTTLRLAVEADPKDGTRLDVEEGKVRLQRKSDGRTAEVSTGHYAVAQAGPPPVSRLARVATSLQALYPFREGKGGLVHDTARVGTPIDLKIDNEQAVRWSSRGLLLTAPTLIASPGPAARIAKECKSSQEVTLELWFRPSTLTPAAKDGRLLTFSSDFRNQNFMVGQDEFQGPVRSYFVRLRTTSTDPVGKPALPLPEGTATAKVTHLTYTRSSAGTAILYVDAVEGARAAVAGSLAAWDESYRLGLGNEFTNDRPWLGEFHLAAIYSRALTAEEVKQNFKAGLE
jgi:hypothetical protein